MDARKKINEYAELQGWNKNKLIGWSEAADFAEWFAALRKTDVSGSLPLFEQFVADDEKKNGTQSEYVYDSAGGSEKYFSWSVIQRWFRRQ